MGATFFATIDLGNNLFLWDRTLGDTNTVKAQTIALGAVPSHLVGLHDDQRVAVANGVKIDIFDISTGNGTADRQFTLPGTLVDLARAHGGNHIVAAY